MMNLRLFSSFFFILILTAVQAQENKSTTPKIPEPKSFTSQQIESILLITRRAT